MIDQTKIYSVARNVYYSKTQCVVYRGGNLRHYNKHNVKAVNINYACLRIFLLTKKNGNFTKSLWQSKSKCVYIDPKPDTYIHHMHLDNE